MGVEQYNRQENRGLVNGPVPFADRDREGSRPRFCYVFREKALKRLGKRGSGVPFLSPLAIYLGIGDAYACGGEGSREPPPHLRLLFI